MAFVSGLARSRRESVFDWITESHLINLRKFVYIGLRDVDDAKKNIITQNGIKTFTIDDIKRYVCVLPCTKRCPGVGRRRNFSYRNVL